MNSLLGKFGIVLVIGLVIFTYAEVWGADLKLYGLGDGIIRYYDEEGITHPSKNIIRIWVKKVYTERGVINMVRKHGSSFENLSQTIGLEEINYSDRKRPNLSFKNRRISSLLPTRRRP